MATALQQQLAVIRAKSSNELDLKAQRAAHSKSLLFEPNVAATQSMETIFQICYEGFQELCALDARFVKFERSIFAPHSRNHDRQLLTAAENISLDAAIEAFLTLVGQRILLKPAVKAVEWLVRRFRVHEQNYEPLILTMLPYHSTPVFPTLLSILPKQLNPTWKFLHPYINKLQSPPRTALVYAATHNPSFFAALNRYILITARAQNTNPTLMTFWASIVTPAVNDMFDTSLSGRKAIQSQREEDMLTRILPTLSEGLGMKQNPELLMGCYIIVTVLVSKANLDDRALNALLAAVVQSSTSDTIEAALSCSAVVAERRESLIFPKSVMRSFLKIEDLSLRLTAIASQQPIQRLVLALSQTVIARISREDVPHGVELLQYVLNSDSITNAQKEVIASQISELPQKLASSTYEEVRAQLEGLIASYKSANENTSQEMLDDKMDIDENEEDANDIPIDTASQELVLPAEAQEEQKKRSFFAKDTSRSFTQLLSSFEQASRHEAHVKQFSSLPFLRGPTAFVTFFARVSAESHSISAKVAALQMLSQYVKSQVDKAIDCQAIVPYALVALADDSAKVRRQVRGLLDALPYHESTASHLGEADFYGASTHELRWLSSKDLSAFFHKSLYPALEECVSDGNHISRVVADALGRTSTTTGTDHSSSDKLRSSQKLDVFLWLTSHMRYTSSLSTQLMLLTTLNLVPKVGGHPRSKYLLPWFKDWTTITDAALEQTCKEQSFDRSRLDEASLQIVQTDDLESMTYLMSVCLEETTARNDFQIRAFQRLVTLWPQFRVNRQTTTAEALLKATLNQSSGDDAGVVQEQAIVTLKSVRIQPEVLATLVEHATTELSHRDQPSSSKRRRTSNMNSIGSAQDSENTKKAVTRLTVVIELVDGQRTGADTDLLYALFRILQALQDFHARSSSDLGYIQNLTLGAASSIMVELEKSSKPVILDASHIRADLLVDSVRNTTSLQARSTALLLLSKLTRYVPQAILHSIMPVFTLMSSTTLRQDDDFSAHVVDQTIQQVVPLLAKSLREQKKDLVAATAEIILSFAAAFEHIAAHRRLRLYRLLASSLGASETLFAIIATLVDHFTQDDEPKGQSDDVDDFVVELFSQHTSLECLPTIVKLIDLCLNSLQPKPTLSQVLLKQEKGFPVANVTRLLAVLPSLLASTTLKAKLKYELANGDETAQLRTLFAQALETMLKLTSAAAKHQVMRPLCSKPLESLLGLFPLNELALSIEPLLSHVDQDIQRSVLKTVELRVRTSKNVNGSSRNAVVQILPRLTEILQDESKAQLQPNALAVIDQICERFGKSDSSAVLEVAQVIAGPACLANNNEIVRVLSLHCLASVVGILQAEFIPLLQQVMQNAISCLESSVQTKSRSLHTAAYAFFTALADNVPFMISKSSLRQVVELSHKSATARLGIDEDDNRTQFLQLVASKVEMVNVLDVVEQTWDHAVQRGPMVCSSTSHLENRFLTSSAQAAHDHLDILSTLISTHTKGSISRAAPSIFRGILACFDLRHSCTSSVSSSLYTPTDITNLESKLLALTIAFVFKINDTIFRPLFSQLLTWSSTAPPKKDAAHRTLRSITFFNLVTALSDKLRSIFTSYFSVLVDRAAVLLSTPATAKDADAIAATTAVLTALTSGLKHDQDDFFASPSHFNAILAPLITQLSVPNATTSALAITALTELARCNLHSNDHHKALNTALLALFRFDSARVRLAAVRAQMSLAKTLGDDWLAQLPQILPAIGELQDDDDEGVARETERWIKVVEEILGESLDAMLQ